MTQAPARVIPTDPELRQHIVACQAWIREHREDYKNRWVALRNGELVADAPTGEELFNRLDTLVDTLQGLYITAIY